MKVWRRWYW